MIRLLPIVIRRTLYIVSLLPALIFAIPAGADKARTLDWLELLPKADRAAMEKLPETMAEMNRQLLEQGLDELSDDIEMPAVLSSTAVRGELDGEYVRVPGFLVPLDINERGEATSFFLVPYFGACIHVPPPPPNQMIYVTFSGGMPPDAMYDPYWITGPLRIETHENDLGVATYAIEADQVSLYRD